MRPFGTHQINKRFWGPAYGRVRDATLARRRRGLTQRELATAAGVSLPTVQRIESGARATLDCIKAVFDALAEIPLDPDKFDARM